MKDTTPGLIVLLALGLLVLPLRAETQQMEKAVRIGVLFSIAPPATTDPPNPLLDALRPVC